MPSIRLLSTFFVVVLRICCPVPQQWLKQAYGEGTLSSTRIALSVVSCRKRIPRRASFERLFWYLTHAMCSCKQRFSQLFRTSKVSSEEVVFGRSRSGLSYSSKFASVLREKIFRDSPADIRHLPNTWYPYVLWNIDISNFTLTPRSSVILNSPSYSSTLALEIVVNSLTFFAVHCTPARITLYIAHPSSAAILIRPIGAIAVRLHALFAFLQ